VRVTLAQLNPIIGDIDGNSVAIEAAIEAGAHDRSDLVVTSELAVLGYPPRDLLLRQGVAARCEDAVKRIAARCTKTTALIGFPQPWPRRPRPFRNAVAVCARGAIQAVYAKRLLPTYDVFDEDRYFTPGETPVMVEIAGERVAVLVCEDLWRSDDVGTARRYTLDPVRDAMTDGATALAVLSASPFVLGKDKRHAEQLAAIAGNAVHVIAVNQSGGNDDLVFDGRSRAYASGCGLVARLAAFRSETRTIELASAAIDDLLTTREDETIDAIVCGIADYLRKTGHRTALLGLSGGIDSALVATLAAIAIGRANVTGVLLPSRHSSRGSIDDALDSARRLGLRAAPIVPIEAGHDALRRTLGGVVPNVEGIVDENIQSRLRGTILMALSNASGAIALTTGNKSEIAVGYATLYGDMNGGLAPIGDVPKTMVYALARHLNLHHARYGFDAPPIPQSSIDKVPSAELRPDQSDQDSLPPYEMLDAIVEGWIDRDDSVDAIVARTGIDIEIVRRWCKSIDRMQYKRDQAAVILKISPRAFGRGRPMPIAHG